MSSKKDKTLCNQVKSFLKKKVNNNQSLPKSVELDMSQLGTIISKIIQSKYQTSMDTPIDFMLINRKTHQSMHYRPLPYTHDTNDPKVFEEYFKMAFMNAGISKEELRLVEYEMNKKFLNKDNEILKLKEENEFLKKVNKGINDADNGKLKSTKQVKKALKKNKKG